MISISSVNLIITAAGSSSRLGIGSKKEYLSMQDEDNNTVLSLACIGFLNVFLDEKISKYFKLASLVITCPVGRIPDAKEALFSNKKISKILEQLKIEANFVEGGDTRQLSVLKALEFSQKLEKERENNLEKDCLSFDNGYKVPSLVLIHDGARPWIDFHTIENVLLTTRERGACVPVVPVTDTIAFSQDGKILSYIDRSSVCGLQTPQGFLFDKLLKAHRKSIEEKRQDCTDDTTIWRTYCGEVFTCTGSTKNTKITFVSDLEKIGK